MSQGSLRQDVEGRAGRLPLRLLVVLPSWVGDAVMATPALRVLRDGLPGAFIGGLARPGIDEVLAGSGLLDEIHVDRARGVMGTKLAAAKVRGRRYDTALLLTNSFSTALITRLAFIPRRIGYDRDGRGMLLTERLKPERSGGWGVFGKFVCVSAVEYYLRAACAVFGEEGWRSGGVEGKDGERVRLELGMTPEQERGGVEWLVRAGVREGERYVMLNPGGNDVAKRWPAERLGEVAAHIVKRWGIRVVVNGAPGEVEVCEEVVRSAGCGDGEVVSLAGLGGSIGGLKRVVKGAALVVTNDTGPRHFAAALGVPVVTLFGPTDPRWTTLPVGGAANVEIVADPTLPSEMVADEHPDRCRIDRIEVGRVVEAVDGVLGKGREGLI